MNDRNYDDESSSGDDSLDDVAFQRALAEVRVATLEYKEQVIDCLDPSPHFLASMQREMVSMVAEDVGREFRRTSFRSRLRERLVALSSTWRELLAHSWAFRFASQGALALGLGLVLAIVYQVQAESSAQAAEKAVEEQTPMVPAASPHNGPNAFEIRRLQNDLPADGLATPVPKRAKPGDRRATPAEDGR